MKTKRIVFNGFQIIFLFLLAIAALSSEWLYGIFILLLLIYFMLDEIHDTLKDSTKGQP